MINRSIVTMGTKYSLLQTLGITSARVEFALRLLLDLYAGADEWIQLMTPIVKEETVSVAQTTSACLNMCTGRSFHDDDQEHVLTWPERRSA